MSCDALTLVTHSADETYTLGVRVGSLLRAGMIVALSGDLGAGKTTFTQGLAHGLGVTAHVTSPTFTLVAEYGARDGMRLVHMDSYRLGDEADAATLEAAFFGVDDLLDDEHAVVVIEWADRLAALLPAGTLHVALDHVASDTDARSLRFSAQAAPGSDVLTALTVTC